MNDTSHQNGAVIAYARTSTADQQAGLDAQVAELEARGATKIFKEKVSSVDADRQQLQAALDYVRDGDTFLVTRPDRLARSTRDLLGIVDLLAAKGVRVRILSMDVDTGTATGKLMLTMLAGIAEFERQLMLERQRAGIAAAKAEGKYKGRAPTARTKGAEVRRLLDEGRKPAEIVRELSISRASFYRIMADAPGGREASPRP